MGKGKIHKAKMHLACYEAIEYLEYLTGAKVSKHDLLSLVRSEIVKCFVFVDDLLPEYIEALNSAALTKESRKLINYAVVIGGFPSIQINNEVWGGLISAFPTYSNPLNILAIYTDYGYSEGEFYELKIYKTQPAHTADIRPLGREQYGLNICFFPDDIQRLARHLNEGDEGEPTRHMAGTKQKNPSTTVYKGMQQEELILSTLKELGYNPKSLPKPPSTGGAKAQVRELLDKKPPFEAKTAFNNAWKGLTSTEEIKTNW